MSFQKLLKSIDDKINKFIRRPQNRHKRMTPNLGNLISMLLLTNKYKWSHISKAYLEESQDRRVLRYLEKFNEIPDFNSGEDFLKTINNFNLISNDNETLLDDTTTLMKYLLNSNLVGQKLLIFNLYLLEKVIKYDDDRIMFMNTIKNNYGYPYQKLKLDLQQEIKDIQMIDTIDEYYTKMNIYKPTDEIMGQNMYQSYVRSNRKGYNKSLDHLKVSNKKVDMDKIINMEWRRK